MSEELKQTGQGRRRFLRNVGMLAAAVPATMSTQALADDLVIEADPVPDIPAYWLADNIYCIVSPWGFARPDNQGMMSNITFLVTEKGVVVIDSGASLQIGEMALRQIRKITDKPIVAVFNSHYHGDHWLGNHAMVNDSPDVKLYSLQANIDAIKSGQGEFWYNLMERSTDNAITGTVVTPPEIAVEHGDEFDFGNFTLRMHHYGTAHTPSDLSVEIVEMDMVHVGDVAMDNRIAFMDDGSFIGSFETFDALKKAVPEAYWIPAHGHPGRGVLEANEELFRGIYESQEKAVAEMAMPDEARAYAMADPRVQKYAPVTDGFEDNIGRYASLAYLEAEAAAF